MNLVNPYIFGVGGGGTPSDSEIIVTANGEIDRNADDLFTFSGVLASGVSGAHGRVYDNANFLIDYLYPGGTEEFISIGCRFFYRTDVTDGVARLRTSAQANILSLQRVAGGTLRVANAANSTDYDSGSANIPLTTWRYGTLFARLHATLGEFIAKLFDESGALIETLDETGINTLTLLAARTAWGGASGDTHVDHLWTDLTGAFRGCGFVETRQATSNGDTNSWTRGGTDTGNNWDQIDEVPKNETSYVFSTGADQVELDNFQDRAQAGTPITVQQVIYAHAHSAGTREWKPICKIGGTIYEGTTQSTTSTSTGTDPTVINWQNNPATGNEWTDAEIDSAQWGYKSVTTDVRVQAMVLHVLVDIES